MQRLCQTLDTKMSVGVQTMCHFEGLGKLDENSKVASQTLTEWR